MSLVSDIVNIQTPIPEHNAAEIKKLTYNNDVHCNINATQYPHGFFQLNGYLHEWERERERKSCPNST